METKTLKTAPDLYFERIIKGSNYKFIAGLDEVGRGALAGPVVACAAILPGNFSVKGINDSKKLTEKDREILYEEIISSEVIYGIGIVNNNVIDKINILQATFEAMLQAIDKLSTKPDYLLIDGNQKLRTAIPQQTVVSGDSLSLSIAVASILAKVTRDRIMKNYQLEFPEYFFEQHKGYATKAHIQAISEHGITPIHRVTFLKNFLQLNLFGTDRT